VCGHYGCGGVKAALSNNSLGLINKWLRHIKDVYRFHQSELDAITDKNEKTKRLIELNVVEQVLNLAETSIVQTSWKNNGYPYLHGWVYDLNDGLIKVLSEVEPNGGEMLPIYRYGNL
jgi:carbonic anhydrase